MWWNNTQRPCPETKGCCAPQGCDGFKNLTSCNNHTANLGCLWRNLTNFCERVQCFSGDRTNITYCQETLNATFGIECTWNAGSTTCNPAASQIKKCVDFTNRSSDCFNFGSCEYIPINGSCRDKAIQSQFKNPPCSVIGSSESCLQITGCAWDGTKCTGNTLGLACSNITNNTLCNTIPLLSSCCSWNSTNCTTSAANTCWSNKQNPPAGAKFCEDYLSFKNESLCKNISSSPFFMPCTWNNSTRECKFNGAAVTGGGTGSIGGGFKDINSKSNCEAGGGSWREKTYLDGGVSKTDTWCEFKFGGSSNCDSGCWGCEKQANGSAWASSAAASAACAASAVGFCEFKANSKAPNTFGFCQPKSQFLLVGGNCQQNCGDCNVMNDPVTACTNSPASCKWIPDLLDPAKGFCNTKNAQSCLTDCFKCFDSQACANKGKGGAGACNWDNLVNLCKPAGFNGEICFDGSDNDNDGKIDCADSDCAFDAFCGGDVLDNKNCGGQGNEALCNATGCVWVLEDGNPEHAHCGFPGSNCFKFNSNGAQCNATNGCSQVLMQGGQCDMNTSLFQQCGINFNQSGCDSKNNCSWKADPINASFGFCGPKTMVQCGMNQSLRNNKTACDANQLCAWVVPPGMQLQQGYCGPKCFAYNSIQCVANVTCEFKSTECQPKNVKANCFEKNGNNTACNILNESCIWKAVPGGPGPDGGFCDDKQRDRMFQDMGNQPPVMLGIDPQLDTVNDAPNISLAPLDIDGFGIKDNKNSYMIGIHVRDFVTAAACKGLPVLGGIGSGTLAGKYYWYLDTDGNNTNHCAPQNATNMTGFEFLFTYSATIVNGNTVESLTARWCSNATNGTWSPIAIPVSTPKSIMCSVIGGPALALDKKTIQGFNEFDKTKSMRVYVATATENRSESNVTDAAGPGFYTPGAVDFGVEDCSAKGQDRDGDGLTAENDPDCSDYYRQGFVSIETGPQCKDGTDNDNDGTTDCLDSGCKYDAFFCGGSFVPDANDKTSPKLKWLDIQAFPDGARISFDTDEPSNGTLVFYSNDTDCITINKTIKDFGLLDPIAPDYNVYHQTPVDNRSFNPQKLGFPLINSTTYYFKTVNCDPSGNCATSKCMNLTTKGSVDDCSACRATVGMGFVPPPGAVVSDPRGNVRFQIKLANGSFTNLTDGGAVSLNYSNADNISLALENPNSTSAWKIGFDGSSLTKLSESASNISYTDLAYNQSNQTPYVGLGTDKCALLISELRPKTLTICIPGNQSDLFQCNQDLNFSSCVNKTAGAVNNGFNATYNNTCWSVPADWGC